ncbi:MAG: ScpA family protein [Nanoarchaeota archaeon]
MEEGHDRIFDILFTKDEITWQTIIYELINNGEIDPWDVNISSLTQKYIDMIKKLQGQDLRVSGKVLLAAALLLRIKSSRLMGRDLENLDRLFSQNDEEDDTLLFEEDSIVRGPEEKYNLIPRTPQPRKRKVSIYDLVGALEKALEVKKRRVIASIPPTSIEIPKKKVDVGDLIKEVYGKIKNYFYQGTKERLTFSKLITENTKEAKIHTFIPLLYLSNQRKVDLAQYQHFGDIEIILNTKQETDKELAENSI